MTSGGKKRSISASSTGSHNRSNPLNFRPNHNQDERRGTRPTPGPTSIGLALVTLVLDVCKKSLLFNTKLRILIYCIALFVGSAIADNLYVPKSYFSRSENVLNLYFIKWGWAWLLVVVGSWIVLTARTLSCGRRTVLLQHLARLVLATLAWMFWIQVFQYVEEYTGRCLNGKGHVLESKSKCQRSGYQWTGGLDISGHAFIIIYSCLILSEEGNTLLGWEGIKDLVVKEEYDRGTEGEVSNGSLKKLSNEELEYLKKSHKVVTPYVRALFVVMTLQQMLWDLMLLGTILYYHVMLEKLIGGFVAIVTWFLTYHLWYKAKGGGFLAPGEGPFKYNEQKKEISDFLSKRRSVPSKVGPTFMGMPLRTGTGDAEGVGSGRGDAQ